jgi:hypothetical protein
VLMVYQQHSRRSFMDPWMPTEDHKIRSGNWTPSVKANEKKKDHYRIVSSSVKFIIVLYHKTCHIPRR